MTEQRAPTMTDKARRRAEAREESLARALKANIARRKEQARSRAGHDDASEEGGDGRAATAAAPPDAKG